MLTHELIRSRAADSPSRPALGDRTRCLSYAELAVEVDGTAAALRHLGLRARDRVAVWLPKSIPAASWLFAASAAGGTFVPVNPVLKPAQVSYQLQHSDSVFLITDAKRLAMLGEHLPACDALRHVILVDEQPDGPPDDPPGSYSVHGIDGLPKDEAPGARAIDADMAAILYTSGSTGRPKGVVLSHRNIVAGAASVAAYLGNHRDDRILALLPLSFDAGFSQLSTGFASGAYVHLMDYLLPRDVLRAVADERITGITGVPSLWNPLSRLDWPDACHSRLRYIANTGGAMPEGTTRALSAKLPDTSVFLMYGLTEAFRSTFLPPGRALEKPTSVGQAIPGAEILIVRPDGSECDAREHGELVHRGVHVALGYWKNPDATAERFKPSPAQPEGLPVPELAVWSGDTAYRDDDGDIYFVARRDAMIKTSGYRVSPTEIEIEALAVDGISDAAAVGAAHPDIGQAIVLYVSSSAAPDDVEARLRKALSAGLPAFMQPRRIVVETALPLNPNGKVDRPLLARRCEAHFLETHA